MLPVTLAVPLLLAGCHLLLPNGEAVRDGARPDLAGEGLHREWSRRDGAHERAIPSWRAEVRGLLCSSATELTSLTTGQHDLDTDAGTLSGAAVESSIVGQSGGPAIRVFAFNKLVLPNGVVLRARGRLALALVACTGILVEGRIDASASASTGGPGGFSGGLADHPGEGPSPGLAAGPGIATGKCIHLCAGGGGGGGHGGRGGDGGTASLDGVLPGGTGGLVSGTTEIATFAGGSGGAGGTSVPGAPTTLPGAGGGGGGAMLLVAGEGIVVGGTGVLVAGGGGGAASRSGGGAGGGAGGAILLEAETVTLATGAVLAANGGGGSGGDCT